MWRPLRRYLVEEVLLEDLRKAVLVDCGGDVRVKLEGILVDFYHSILRRWDNENTPLSLFQNAKASIQREPEGGYQRECFPTFKSKLTMPTTSDGVVQHDGDMQQNSCRVELKKPPMVFDGRGLKGCVRALRIIYEVCKGPGAWRRGGWPGASLFKTV